MSRFHLSRRFLLRGSSVAIGLPLLEAMMPSVRGAAAATPPPPRRFIGFMTPCGYNMADWVPFDRAGYSASSILSPLEPLKQKVLVVMGLDAKPALTPGAGHTGGVCNFLTSHKVPQTTSNPVCSISIDQLMAQALSQYTPRRASLELGTSLLTQTSGEPDYAIVYKNHIAWKGPTQPLPVQINPATVFNSLFAGVSTAGSTTTAAQLAAQKRAFYRTSVLDTVRDDATRLNQRLGTADQHKMQEYLDSVRELEQRIAATQTQMPTNASCAPGSAPPAPSTTPQRVQQMLDLIVTAYTCDLTRVATFMYEHTVTSIAHSWLGVNDAWHIGVSHHGGNAATLAKYTKVNRWMVSQLMYLMTKLEQVKEPDGTLLDNTVIFFGSEMSDGDGHTKTNMPVLVAGGTNCGLRSGRTVAATHQPMANLHVSLLRAMGLDVTSFGDDGTGPLSGLT